MAYPLYSGYAISIRFGERYMLRELWRIEYTGEQNK